MPVRLRDSEKILGLAFRLSQTERGHWMWGLDHPQLLTEPELTALKSTTASTPD